MSNTHPEPSEAATTSSEAMSIDEPDFSGLMALTEASIRRKLSELKYPGSEFSGSLNEDDPETSVLSVGKGQASQSLQTKGQSSNEIKQSDTLQKQSDTSDSSYIGNSPPSAGTDSELEQPKTNSQGEQSKNNILEEQKNSIQVGTVNNSMTLLSALDDPDLFKIVSMGSNSSNADSNLKQSVKYCGLSVDLPTENKSPGSKQSPESVKYCGLNMDVSAEKKSSSPKLSPENVRKNIDLNVTPSAGKKSPPSKLSPESVKYCGLNMEVSSQGKTQPSKQGSDSSECESVIRNISFEFEDEKSNADKNKLESVEKAAYDIPPSEVNRINLTEVASFKQTNEDKLNEDNEIVDAEEVTSVIINSKDRDNENLSEDDNIKCQSEAYFTEKSDESKETVSDKVVASGIVMSIDLEDEKVVEKDGNLAQTGNENLDEDAKTVSDKSEIADTMTVDSELEKVSEEGDSMKPQNEKELNVSAERDQTSMEVLEEIDPEVQTGLPLPEKEIVTVADQVVEQVPENDFGLVISDVCSTSEATEDEMKESQVESADDQLQKEEDSQESTVSSAEISSDQYLAENTPILTSKDTPVEVATDADDAVSEKSHQTLEIETKSDNDNRDGLLNDPQIDDNSDSVDNEIKSLVATVSAELNSEKIANTNELVKTNSESPTMSCEESNKSNLQTVRLSESQQSNQDKFPDNLNTLSESADDIIITEVVSLDSSKKNDLRDVRPIVPAPVNMELSALESMVMRVTKNQQGKGLIETQAISKNSDNINNSSAVNIPPSVSTTHENGLNRETIDIQNNGEKTGGVSERNNEIQTNKLNALKDLVTVKERSNSSEIELLDLDNLLPQLPDRQVKDSENKIRQDIDSNNSASSESPVSRASDYTKSRDVTVTESSSLAEVGEMLMITNVRTISLDEAEQLNQENEGETDNQSMTTNNSEKMQENEPTNQNESLTANERIQLTEVNDRSSGKDDSSTEFLPSTSAENSATSQSEMSKNRVKDVNRTHPLNHVGSKSAKEAVNRRNMYSLVDKAYLTRKYPSSCNSSSPAISSTSGESNSSLTSTPAASSTGMPVIANTFTVKEEPMDYEPYGMPDTVAVSRMGQASNAQPSNYQISTESDGVPVRGRPMTRPRQSSSERQFYNVTMVRQDNGSNPRYAHTPTTTTKQFVNIGKNAQIVSGKVVTSSSVSQTNNFTHAAYSSSQNNAKGVLQRQKSPVTVIMNQNAKPTVLSGHPILRKVNVSKASTGAVKVPKVQAIKKHIIGPPVQPAQNHPSVVDAPTKVTNMVTAKHAMNLKTINIETVGIPVITEMIARKNPLPVYKPPPPPKSVLGNEKTKQTFPCYECGDTFYFTSSLEQHVNRCSMKISYKCEWCKKILMFTNKCQLLSHLRSHMNIDKNQAVPIHIKSDSIEIQTNFDDIIPGKEFKWFKIPDKENVANSQESQIVINMSGNSHPQIVRLCKANECTECKLNFYKKDENAKSIHFAPDKSVKPIFCGKCPMYLHNHCGMKAHRRLHEDLSKGDFLVCPECGICYENKIQMIPLFLQHIKTKCFHLSRFSSIRCSKCNGNCSGMDELRHHLTISVEQYYKCNRCPMALKTLKSFKTHFSQTHKDKDLEKEESSRKAKAKIIYRCHVCDTLIDDKEFLLSHIEKHLAEIKEQAQDYFHCLQCGLIFFEKKSLTYHFFQSHKAVVKENFCTLCRSMKNDQVEFSSHILENHVAPAFRKKAEICEQCGLVCADQNGLRVHECHMKNVAFIVQGDNSASQKDKKTKSPRKEVQQKKSPQNQIKVENKGNFRNILPKPAPLLDKIPLRFRKGCPKCDETYFSNYKRVDHLRSHADNGIFICIYCEKTNFEDYADLIRHENVCANSSDQEDPIPKHLSKTCPSCEFIYGGNNKRTYHIRAHRGDKVFICLFCDAMNFNDYAELRSHEVVCGALSKTTVKSSDESPSRTKIKLKFSKGKISGKVSPKKSEQYQLEYKCDDCGQLFSRKEKQEEHTRLEHGIHPCHLCGLMYESQTSLKKHLLISHEGKKCVYYCWVCRRRKFFSDVAHLQKHFTMKHKQKVWDPAKAVPELPGFGSHDIKTTQPSKRRLESTPEKSDSPVKKLRIEGDKGFKCAKCNFMSEERKDFQAHIKEHKTEDSVQCIECGLCFMVIPSLRKHLFMVHKVRDFDAYLKEHNIEDLKEPEESDSESDSTDSIEREEIVTVDNQSESSEEEMGNPLECKVCYKAFDTEHSMKSHMRIHGMAFIKKTRRSLGSSAKKPKLDISKMDGKTDEIEAKTDEKPSETENKGNHVEMADKEVDL